MIQIFIILEFRNQKAEITMLAGLGFLTAVTKTQTHACPLAFPVVADNPWYLLVCHSIIPASASDIIWTSSPSLSLGLHLTFLQRHQLLDLRSTLIQYDLILI